MAGQAPGATCRVTRSGACFLKVPLHAEELRTAYLNPGSAASRNILQRQDNEYRTLPPRHSCTCWPGHCRECKRLDDQRPKGSDIGPEIGRTSHVTPAMPSPTMLDLARAEDVLGQIDDIAAIARYMSLNGTSLAAAVDVDERQDAQPLRTQRRTHPVAVECELTCLMCSRSAVIGDRQCRWCGGSLVVTTVA
jgi:hypothetical protein